MEEGHAFYANRKGVRTRRIRCERDTRSLPTYRYSLSRSHGLDGRSRKILILKTSPFCRWENSAVTERGSVHDNPAITRFRITTVLHFRAKFGSNRSCTRNFFVFFFVFIWVAELKLVKWFTPTVLRICTLINERCPIREIVYVHIENGRNEGN